MKAQKINIIIQARMGSTRLPGKILKPIMGSPMLGYLLERLARIQTPHTLIVATTTNPQDNEIEDFIKHKKILVFRGSEEDVLDRYYQTCLKFPADLIVRITSDCPLMDPAIVDQAIQRFQKHNTPLDYLSNTVPRTFPRGMDVEVFTFAALKVASQEASSVHDREHVTPFFYKQPQRFHLAHFTHQPDISHYRLTVDTAEDFLLISKIFEELYPMNKTFTLKDILLALERNPKWKEINAHIKQKES